VTPVNVTVIGIINPAVSAATASATSVGIGIVTPLVRAAASGEVTVCVSIFSNGDSVIIKGAGEAGKLGKEPDRNTSPTRPPAPRVPVTSIVAAPAGGTAFDAKTNAGSVGGLVIAWTAETVATGAGPAPLGGVGAGGKKTLPVNVSGGAGGVPVPANPSGPPNGSLSKGVIV
jgi:hypothetical protein